MFTLRMFHNCTAFGVNCVYTVQNIFTPMNFRCHSTCTHEFIATIHTKIKWSVRQAFLSAPSVRQRHATYIHRIHCSHSGWCAEKRWQYANDAHHTIAFWKKIKAKHRRRTRLPNENKRKKKQQETRTCRNFWIQTIEGSRHLTTAIEKDLLCICLVVVLCRLFIQTILFSIPTSRNFTKFHFGWWINVLKFDFFCFIVKIKYKVYTKSKE